MKTHSNKSMFYLQILTKLLLFSRLNKSRETPNSTISLPHQEHENNVEELETPEEPPEQLEQSTELDLVYDEQDSTM